MNGDERERDARDEAESWLSGWEQQCADDIEAQPDFEQSLTAESDSSHRKMWSIFQDSATSIAQLYRDRSDVQHSTDPGALWISFQTAAGTVTSMYREASDSVRRSSEVARQCGLQKRNRELLHWAKRKRALIRRDDLLAYLSGKPPPPPTIRSHHHTATERVLNHLDLDTFREALTRGHRNGHQVTRSGDLSAFITGEIQRHSVQIKRSASPGTDDVTMDSPTHHPPHIKRPRYT